jgi:oligopeptide/dipeptide ABC transporter ATP-binding protein
MSTTESIVAVEDLCVFVGNVAAVQDVSFDIAPGERVGLIGESGSGKSLTALSMMGLLGDGLHATGQVLFRGRDLIALDEAHLSDLRGAEISMIFQEPMTALNPVKKVGDQVAETLRIHQDISRPRARGMALEMLHRVHLREPEKRMNSYPHQLSGGQRQRVVIALSLVGGPSLVIADEPTTALDVTVQAEVLKLLVELVEAQSAALILITHDLPVVANTCERVMVMYGGRIVESGRTSEVFADPQHPYTRGLLLAVPEIDEQGTRMDRLPTIPGVVPALGRFPQGCVFRDRCDRSSQACLEEPSLVERRGGGVACWHPVES